jgi:limonene-1,2-epoxide hydrolase
MTPPAPSQIVHDFLVACALRDLDAALAMVAEDIEYDNVPVGKVFGPEGVRSVLSSGIMAQADEVEWVILRQVAEGAVVMSERVDRFRIGEHWLEISVVGVFELSDGRILLWRDYFDVESYRRQRSTLAAPLASAGRMQLR